MYKLKSVKHVPCPDFLDAELKLLSENGAWYKYVLKPRNSKAFNVSGWFCSDSPKVNLKKATKEIEALNNL